MKKIRVVIPLLLALTIYWFGYQHGSGVTRNRLNAESSDRQVGSTFRQGHNDVSQFKVAGDASTVEKHLQEK